MQLRSLEVFVTVAEQKSFTKAAEALYIGQPALSKTIQKLEQELSVTLIDRSSRRIELTNEGKLLYQKSKEILVKVHSIPEHLNEISQEIIGEVKVGIPQIIGSVFFPQVAYQFLESYPKVTIKTEEHGGVIVENLVTQGDLDIGFVVLPAANTLDAELIYQDKFVVCVSSKHPLSKMNEVSLSDLKNEKFIFFAKSFALYNLIRNHCLEAGFSPDIAFQSTQWDLVLELVSAQLGISIIPKKLSTKLNDVDIVILPISETKMSWDIGIITKKGTYQSPALKKFISMVRAIYSIK